MLVLCNKLRTLKLELKKFNKHHFSGISLRVLAAKALLEHIQLAILANPSETSLVSQEKQYWLLILLFP